MIRAAEQATTSQRDLLRARLRPEVKSGLEWIPLMAMNKDRDRRYRSAAEMGRDISNFLEGKPLRAQTCSGGRGHNERLSSLWW